MHRKTWPAALAAAALTTAALTDAGTAAAVIPSAPSASAPSTQTTWTTQPTAPTKGEHSTVDRQPVSTLSASAAQVGTPLATTTTGTATLTQVVDITSLQAGGETLTATGPLPDRLTSDGTVESLPTGPSGGTKLTQQASTDSSGPNASSSLLAAPSTESSTVKPMFSTPPTTVYSSFDASDQFNSECSGCSPPDTNAAVGTTQIAEIVNARLAVWTKTGTSLCAASLYSILGVTDHRLADPRITFDNLNNRYVFSFMRVPASSADVPTYYVAASTADDACGTFWLYTVTFSGPMFPLGTQIDFPFLGQDRLAILAAANNYNQQFNPSYINSGGWSLPKNLLYAGTGFTFPVFPMSFSSAPVNVAGIPIFSTTASYFLASVPGTGYNLYKMTNSGTTSPTMVLQAAVSAPFTAPSRRVNQPGTSITLDPMDGRIVWQPVQDGNFVWFTHGIDLSGYPSVRYGAINTSTNVAYVATAYKSATSDDFNPSIGVTDAGFNTNYVWLNWAYTDTPAAVPTSVTVSGVSPGQGVPNLFGGLDLVNGITTNGNFRFGDYSSVSIDPTASSGTCPAGRVAVLAQEYFRDIGIWQDRISRVGFC